MAKMAGNKIIAIGIKNLKLWSKVNEITTQYRLNKKYPNPKYHPYLKKDLLLDNSFFSMGGVLGLDIFYLVYIG